MKLPWQPALKAESAQKRKDAPAVAHPNTTEAVVPIQTVHGAFVQRSDINAWSGLILIQGVLFDLLHEQEQDLILQKYRGFLHTLRGPIQIVLMTTPLHVEEEILRFQSVKPQYPGDPLPVIANDIAMLLQQTTHDLETMTNIMIVTAPTEQQCQQETDSVIHALRNVHPDLNPTLPNTDEVLHLFALGFGFDNPVAPNGIYEPVWQL